MKQSRRRSLVATLSIGLIMGLASMQVVASAGDPVDPPRLGPGPGANEGDGSMPVPPQRIQDISDRFVTSLHATRRGKERFYSAYWDLDGDGDLEDNGGFQHSVIELYGEETAKYDNLPCKECHYPPAVESPDTDTDEETFPGDCTDCHWNYNAEDYGVPAYDIAYCDVDELDAVVIAVCPEGYDPATRISQDGVCLACHGRQGAEHILLTDVHRDIDAANPGEPRKFSCMGCHQEGEVHGDQEMLDSHLDNPKTSCAQSGCHARELEIGEGSACRGDQGERNERCENFHKQHMEDVDCTSCHVAENTSCNSCHFDSELDHRKRFYRQIPAKGFKFLMNFKDIQNPEVTKVRTASYQSLTVGAVCEDGDCKTEEAQTFVVFAPYASHSVTRADELECMDCHVKENDDGGYEGNPALVKYLTEGTVTTTTWNPDAGVAGLLEGPTGIIPLPHDWAPQDGGSLAMDFAYYLGNTTDPVTKNPEGDKWAFLKTGPDRGHAPYGSPLSEEQIQNMILSEESDLDGDGTPDNLDNCILVANGPLIPDAGGNIQRDTDADGYGNICDPDLDNDLSVNAADLEIFKPLYFSNEPDADFDGNGTVGASDLAIMKIMFFKAPGPSGIAP